GERPRHLGERLRLGLRLLGHRPLLVVRRGLCLAGAHASPPDCPGAAWGSRMRPDDYVADSARAVPSGEGPDESSPASASQGAERPLPDHVTMPLLALVTRQSLD